jgi:hypothetical protein
MWMQPTLLYFPLSMWHIFLVITVLTESLEHNLTHDEYYGFNKISYTCTIGLAYMSPFGRRIIAACRRTSLFWEDSKLCNIPPTLGDRNTDRKQAGRYRKTPPWICGKVSLDRIPSNIVVQPTRCDNGAIWTLSNYSCWWLSPKVPP